MANENINLDKINEIIKRNFVIPKDKVEHYPPIFRKGGFTSAVFISDYFMILSFLDIEQEGLFAGYSEKINNPFPGFIILSKDRSPVAFKLENNSRNNYFLKNKVDNLYSFSVGEDTTFIVQEHHQKINFLELGNIEYEIDLAYIVTFGDEINKNNFHEYLERLIIFSISKWRS